MHTIEVTEAAMPATERCDRCGAQAWVEVALANDAGTLLFCAHHATEHLPKFESTEAMVADHRPFLKKIEDTMAAETKVLNG